MHLDSPVQNVNAFLFRDDVIAIEVCRALLELGEVLHRFQRSLRAEKALNIDSAQRWSVYPVAIFLRANITYFVRGAIGVAVRVAIKTGNPATRVLRTPVLCLIELLLWKCCQKQPQSYQLLGI